MTEKEYIEKLRNLTIQLCSADKVTNEMKIGDAVKITLEYKGSYYLSKDSTFARGICDLLTTEIATLKDKIHRLVTEEGQCCDD